MSIQADNLWCLCCAYSEEVTKEQVKAWRTLAEQGDAEAKYNLGLCYDNGDGVPEDDITAYMWFNLASAQGLDTAKISKDIIAKRMTKEQVAEGQKLSREWQERFDKREKKYLYDTKSPC